MSALLQLSSGNLIDPFQIKAVIKFAGKGVMFRNEYNKIITFEPEVNQARQEVIVKVIYDIVQAGKHWQAPDWDAEFQTVAKLLPLVDAKFQQNTNLAKVS